MEFPEYNQGILTKVFNSLGTTSTVNFPQNNQLNQNLNNANFASDIIIQPHYGQQTCTHHINVEPSKYVETGIQRPIVTNANFASGIIIQPHYTHAKETVQVTTRPAPPAPAPVVEKQTIIERPVYNEHPPAFLIQPFYQQQQQREVQVQAKPAPPPPTPVVEKQVVVERPANYNYGFLIQPHYGGYAKETVQVQASKPAQVQVPVVEQKQVFTEREYVPNYVVQPYYGESIVPKSVVQPTYNYNEYLPSQTTLTKPVVVPNNSKEVLFHLPAEYYSTSSSPVSNYISNYKY